MVANTVLLLLLSTNTVNFYFYARVGGCIVNMQAIPHLPYRLFLFLNSHQIQEGGDGDIKAAIPSSCGCQKLISSRL